MINKIVRMMRHQWWIIAAVALLGAAAGLWATQLRNDAIQPEFSASVVIAELDQATDDRNEVRTQDAAEQAYEMALSQNDDLVSSGVALIEVNDRAGTLTFTVTGSSEAGALSTMQGMVSRLLGASSEQVLEDRQQRLEEIIVEANAVLAQIDTLNPITDEVAPVVVPEDVQNNFANLDSVLGALQPQLTSLEIDRILAELGDESVGPIEEIDLEIAAFTARIDEVRSQMLAIAAEWGLASTRLPETQLEPIDETGTAPTQEELEVQWQLDALSTQYDALGNEFETLFALGDSVQLPLVGTPEVIDLTPGRGSFAVFGFLGALFGSLLALGTVSTVARIQRRAYIGSDLAPVPVLAEMPALVGRRSERTTIPPERLEGVKAIRNSLITLIKSSSTTPAIGLSRLSIEPQHVRELSIELGRRLAASDLRVLLLDLDLDAAPSQGDLSQYHSMTEFWSEIRRDPEAGADLLQRILADRFDASPSTMCVIMAGAVQGESDDLVLTRSFAIFLDVCRQEADIILAVAPDSEASATQSLLQRLDGVIAVSGVGVSTRTQLVDLANNAQAGGARLLGTTLLTGSLRRDRSGSADSHGGGPSDVADGEAVDFSAFAQNGSGGSKPLDELADSVVTTDRPN